MPTQNDNGKLTSRKRVKRTLERRKTDRVPIDIGGTTATGIHVDEYLQISKYLGIDAELPKVYDQFQMLARVEGFMRSRLCSDVILLENPTETWGLKNERWKVWITAKNNQVLMPGDFNPIKGEDGCLYLFDTEGRAVAYKSQDALYFEKKLDMNSRKYDDLMSPEEWAKSIPLYTDEELYQLNRSAKYLFEYTDYSIHGNFQKGKLGTTGKFAGQAFTDWLCILMDEQEYAFSIVQATAERAVENLRLYLQAVEDYIDTIMISTTDYGTQRSELFNPKIFHSIYMPNMKIINDFVHKNSRVKTMYHSCGSIWNIMEYFIEAGVDIINPVQTGAANMDPQKLKDRFGERIIFWGGGCDTQGVMQFGSADEVAEHVKQRVDVFSKEGGFVFSPIHNIQYGVPPENVIRAIDTAVKYGAMVNGS